jgi:hypothetical protein
MRPEKENDRRILGHSLLGSSNSGVDLTGMQNPARILVVVRMLVVSTELFAA